MSVRAKAGAVAPLLVLVLAACGGGGHEGHTAAQSSASGSASAPASVGAVTPSAAGQAGFNQQDVSFAQNMIMHHRQAVDLAALVEDRTSTAAVRDLAASVTASQSPEIDLMSRWLGAWGAQVPEDMSQMDMAGSMPGMQSLSDMRALAELEGADFDRKWLAMMRDHHVGAITMAEQQLASGSNAEAKNLATQVIDEQSAEITLIGNLLK